MITGMDDTTQTRDEARGALTAAVEAQLRGDFAEADRIAESLLTSHGQRTDEHGRIVPMP